MALETRTRITILVPSPTTAAQIIVLNDALDELIAFCGGITTTHTSGQTPAAYDSPLFAGCWFDTKTNNVVQDGNVYIFGDAPLPVRDHDLQGYLEVLKVEWQQKFEQDIIWIIIHEVQRVANDDYRRD